MRDAEIARRLGVQQSTVLRRLGPAAVQGELEEPGLPAAAGRVDQPRPEPGPELEPRAQRQIAWAKEEVQLKDYGQARQITLFEHDKVVLQILTSDSAACPADILAWLKSRWREENFLKYASENYGIDAICDYLASIEANTKLTDNPARKKASARVREAEKSLAAAERGLATLLADPAVTPAVKNTRLIPAAQRKIAAARRSGKGPGRDPRQAAR